MNDDMHAWAHQQELEEQYYNETDFTPDGEHYFSRDGIDTRKYADKHGGWEYQN